MTIKSLASRETKSNKDSDHLGQDKSIAVILGSAFSKRPPHGLSLIPREIPTPWGMITLYAVDGLRRHGEAYIIFRHGLPHDTLPHLVNYRAYAFALKVVKCGALLITSSVGVLDPHIPLDQPLMIADLLMPENRLPNGELCTMFTLSPQRPHLPLKYEDYDWLAPGHLVIGEGLCSLELSQQVSDCLSDNSELRHSSTTSSSILSNIPKVVFAYAPGPRTKTSIENHYWSMLGAQVNSMSVGPEIILANELEIPTAGLVIGHKRSSSKALDQKQNSKATQTHHKSSQDESKEMAETLERSHTLLERVVVNFLQTASPVPFKNYIYRFPPPDDKKNGTSVISP